MIDFHPPFHPLVCTWLIVSDLAKNCEFLSNLWPRNREKRKCESSVQELWRQSAFQRSSRRGYLRWRSNCQCATCVELVLPSATGVPSCLLPCFHPCFCSLLPVNVPIWNQLSLPLFCLGCIKKLCFFFVYFLCHLQFPITKSELVLLWPLRSRPVIKCRFNLKS